MDEPMTLSDHLHEAKTALAIAADCINVAVYSFEKAESAYAKMLVAPFNLKSE